jgi:hypothetical protein
VGCSLAGGVRFAAAWALYRQSLLAILRRLPSGSIEIPGRAAPASIPSPSSSMRAGCSGSASRIGKSRAGAQVPAARAVDHGARLGAVLLAHVRLKGPAALRDQPRAQVRAGIRSPGRSPPRPPACASPRGRPPGPTPGASAARMSAASCRCSRPPGTSLRPRARLLTSAASPPFSFRRRYMAGAFSCIANSIISRICRGSGIIGRPSASCWWAVLSLSHERYHRSSCPVARALSNSDQKSTSATPKRRRSSRRT